MMFRDGLNGIGSGHADTDTSGKHELDGSWTAAMINNIIIAILTRSFVIFCDGSCYNTGDRDSEP